MISIINVIDDEVVNAMEVDFESGPLVSVLWNLRKDEIEEYDEEVASLTGLSSYTKKFV